MHLYRKVIRGIDELEQQGEMVTEQFIHAFAHQFIHISLQQVLQAVSGMRAVDDLCRVFLYVRHHPCLAYVLIVGGHMVVPLLNRMPSPNLMEEMRLEFKRV